MLTSVLLLLVSTASEPLSKQYEWKRLYYVVLGQEVMLWDDPRANHCILGAGPTEVVSRLEAQSNSGEAHMLVEVLPAPKALPPPPGAIIFHQRVRVRGISVEPQCEPSKGLYWIRDYRFISDKLPKL